MHATVSAVTRSRHIRPPENASLLAVLLCNCTCDVKYILLVLPVDDPALVVQHAYSEPLVLRCPKDIPLEKCNCQVRATITLQKR